MADLTKPRLSLYSPKHVDYRWVCAVWTDTHPSGFGWGSTPVAAYLDWQRVSGLVQAARLEGPDG